MKPIEFATLYKKTATEAIQYWSIRVYPVNEGGEIETEYGQLNTPKPQITRDVITKGKNLGKINETTPFEQAKSEAKSRYEKQLKSGYVTSIESAQNNETDKIIEGGIKPMLAHKFADHVDKLEFPVAVSPKLDGLRIIATIKDGKASLWSRTQKRINSLPHIVKELETVFHNLDIVLDGEAYQDKYSNDFEKIVSAVRKDNPEKGHEMIQYHVFDMVSNNTFEKRYQKLVDIFNQNNFENLILVKNTTVNSEEEIFDYFEQCRNTGYEGCMVRNLNSLYVNKRSKDLLKVKEMDDAEFQIIGIEEGRGKLSGHVGSFVCLKDGKEFNVKMKGDTEKLKEYFDNHSLWKNKLLTVQFQGFTSYGIPRFPVGLRLRECDI